MPIDFSDDQLLDMARRYEAGESTARLASTFGVSSRTIASRLRRRGVTLREGARKYVIRHDAFDRWEDDRAARYWLGFIMGDGSIRDGAAVVVRLARRDLKHLEKLRTFVGGNHRIYLSEGESWGGNGRRVPLAELVLSSSRMVRSCARAGIVCRKSLTAEAHPDLAISSDFWRGVIDANGTVVSSCTGRSQRRIQLVGSRPLMEQFADFAALACGTARPRIMPWKCITKVYVSGPWAHDLTHLLWGEANLDVSLERKVPRAMEIMAGPRLRYRQRAERWPRSHHS